MHIYGDIPSAGALGILVLFSLYLGLYHALFAFAARHIVLRSSRALSLCIIPVLWVAVELARDRITGFPWDLLGYTQVDSALLTKLAPVTGVMGLSLVIAAVNVLWLVRGSAWRRFAGPACAVAVVIASSWTVAPRRAAATETAILLQENLSVGAESRGLKESRAQMLSAFEQLSLEPSHGTAQSPAMIIWPEAPADFFDADAGFRDALGSLAKQAHSPIIADSISIAPTDTQGVQHVYNTASFFAPDGEHVGRYDKMHLVPFGEYTPYKEFFSFAGHLLDNVGPFLPGTVRQVFAINGHRYGTFICYESIFGDEIREFTKLGADVLVNISDDGWYGDTSAPWEHLDMARMRAIENSRWVLRATNTGLTASIDPQGRLVAQLPRHIRGSIAVPFEFRNGITFYTEHGDWIGWLCAALSACALLFGMNARREVN